MIIKRLPDLKYENNRENNFGSSKNYYIGSDNYKLYREKEDLLSTKIKSTDEYKEEIRKRISEFMENLSFNQFTNNKPMKEEDYLKDPPLYLFAPVTYSRNYQITYDIHGINEFIGRLGQRGTFVIVRIFDTRVHDSRDEHNSGKYVVEKANMSIVFNVYEDISSLYYYIDPYFGKYVIDSSIDMNKFVNMNEIIQSNNYKRFKIVNKEKKNDNYQYPIIYKCLDWNVDLELICEKLDDDSVNTEEFSNLLEEEFKK